MPEATAQVAPTAMPPWKPLDKDFAAEEERDYLVHSLTLPVGIPFEACLAPEFWVHIAKKLGSDPISRRPARAGGIIRVRTADHAFCAELYVVAVQERGLIVKTYREPVYFGPQTVDTEAYEVRWNVGKRKFDIIRKSDKEIVSSADTKELAADWIARTSGATAKAA